MQGSESLIVPTAIQRIRSFLIEMCGMKVKPWASTEETLAALHRTLVARHPCDVFWSSLRTLLENLAHDLKQRTESERGRLLDNEVLDSERYASLLGEIRTCLASQTADNQPSSFRRLAGALSAPAFALLLLLGGATTIGCADNPLQGGKRQDAAVGASTDTPAQRDVRPDNSLAITLPPQPDAAPDQSNVFILPSPPDTGPPTYAASVGPDGGAVTIQDIMDSCNVTSDVRKAVLSCLARLNDSWSAGVATVLAGTNCSAVRSDLECFGMETCAVGPTPANFDPKTTRICQPIVIYVGVRFV
jgi:hypothetical protein